MSELLRRAIELLASSPSSEDDIGSFVEQLDMFSLRPSYRLAILKRGEKNKELRDAFFRDITNTLIREIEYAANPDNNTFLVLGITGPPHSGKSSVGLTLALRFVGISGGKVYLSRNIADTLSRAANARPGDVLFQDENEYLAGEGAATAAAGLRSLVGVVREYRLNFTFIAPHGIPPVPVHFVLQPCGWRDGITRVIVYTGDMTPVGYALVEVKEVFKSRLWERYREFKLAGIKRMVASGGIATRRISPERIEEDAKKLAGFFASRFNTLRPTTTLLTQLAPAAGIAGTKKYMEAVAGFARALLDAGYPLSPSSPPSSSPVSHSPPPPAANAGDAGQDGWVDAWLNGKNPGRLPPPEIHVADGAVSSLARETARELAKITNLNPRQQHAVELYLEGMKITEAAAEAGLDNHMQLSRLLRKPAIARALGVAFEIAFCSLRGLRRAGGNRPGLPDALDNRNNPYSLKLWTKSGQKTSETFSLVPTPGQPADLGPEIRHALNNNTVPFAVIFLPRWSTLFIVPLPRGTRKLTVRRDGTFSLE